MLGHRFRRFHLHLLGGRRARRTVRAAARTAARWRHRQASRGWAAPVGKSKDHRDDLLQMVIAMAVTRDGIPVRAWIFSGSENDRRIIRTIKDDLGAWNLHRLVWVADRGFASAANRAYLTRGGGHYIHADNLRVKEIRVAPGGSNTEGARADGRVAQRSALTDDQKTILAALDLPEPPKYLDLAPSIDAAVAD